MANELVIGAGLPQNKAEIEVYNESVKELALSGDCDIIKLSRQVNIMKRIVETFEKDKDIQEVLIKECEKYGKGELKEIQVKEVGTKYDFSECGLPEYEKVCASIEKLNERKKELEMYLKTVKPNTEFIDPKSGECVMLNPPIKTSTTKAVFTIK